MDFKTYYLDQAGGNYSYFKGAARQRGYGLGGMFKSMFKYLIPLFRTHALPVIKKGAEIVGTEAVKAASNIATDTIKGRNIRDAFQEHSTSAIDNLSNQAQAKLQSGSGRKRKRSSFKSNRKVKQTKTVRFKTPKIRRLADIFD
jgi:hypothetical protein